MKDAVKSAKARISQLRRQRNRWVEENAQDQKGLQDLFQKEDRQIEELEATKEAIQEKYSELSGENLHQLNTFSQMILEAEADLAKLLV